MERMSREYLDGVDHAALAADAERVGFVAHRQGGDYLDRGGRGKLQCARANRVSGSIGRAHFP